MQEKLYGRPVLVADREMVEQGAEAILEEARNSDVAFLVVGDPFGYYPTPHYVFGLSLIPRSLKTHPVKKQNC